MNAVEGHVRGSGGTDAELPEGAKVVVLTGNDVAFDVDDAELTELKARMTEADRGELEPAEVGVAKLRQR